MDDSEAVEELRGLLAKYLDELGINYLRDSRDDFVILFREGVRVHVVPQALTGEMTIVQIIAPINLGANVTGELAMFIAEANVSFVFGRLALYRDNAAVGFEQALLGNFLNRTELEVAIEAAVVVADKYGDEIAQRFGGDRSGSAF